MESTGAPGLVNEPLQSNLSSCWQPVPAVIQLSAKSVCGD